MERPGQAGVDLWTFAPQVGIHAQSSVKNAKPTPTVKLSNAYFRNFEFSKIGNYGSAETHSVRSDPGYAHFHPPLFFSMNSFNHFPLVAELARWALSHPAFNRRFIRTESDAPALPIPFMMSL